MSRDTPKCNKPVSASHPDGCNCSEIRRLRSECDRWRNTAQGLAASHAEKRAEIERLKALLPDEREREALRWVRVLVRQFPHSTIQPRALAALDKLLAASHSEGSGT